MGREATGIARSGATRALRRLDDPLEEWRFVPKPSARAMVAVVLLSLGGVALGVGVYGEWLRDEAVGALAAAPYLLVVGIVLVGAYVGISRHASRIVRVGDLGVGYELSPTRVQRTPWYAFDRVALDEHGLVLESESTRMSLGLQEHEAAARRIVHEARRRIAKRLQAHEQDVHRLGAPRSSDGEPMSIDPPQVTGQRCMSSDQPLTFEKDVRMCARCAALYHKSGVPKRCAGCGVKLRG